MMPGTQIYTHCHTSCEETGTFFCCNFLFFFCKEIPVWNLLSGILLFQIGGLGVGRTRGEGNPTSKVSATAV